MEFKKSIVISEKKVKETAYILVPPRPFPAPDVFTLRDTYDLSTGQSIAIALVNRQNLFGLEFRTHLKIASLKEIAGELYRFLCDSLNFLNFLWTTNIFRQLSYIFFSVLSIIYYYLFLTSQCN